MHCMDFYFISEVGLFQIFQQKNHSFLSLQELIKSCIPESLNPKDKATLSGKKFCHKYTIYWQLLKLLLAICVRVLKTTFQCRNHFLTNT